MDAPTPISTFLPSKATGGLEGLSLEALPASVSPILDFFSVSVFQVLLRSSCSMMKTHWWFSFVSLTGQLKDALTQRHRQQVALGEYAAGPSE